MWNPKYPVCIRLAGGSNSREDEGGGSEPSSSSERDPDPPATLYLFGRTGREKEEWFRHFLFASMDGEGEAGRSGTRWMCVDVWLMGYMLRFSASLRRHAMASGKEKCECLKPESFAFHLPTQISLHRASNSHTPGGGIIMTVCVYLFPNAACVVPGEPAAAPGGSVPSGRVGGSEEDGDDADDAPPTSPVACVPPAPVSQSSGGAGGLSPPDYPSYMARLLAAEEGPPPRSPAAGGTESSPTLKGKVGGASGAQRKK